MLSQRRTCAALVLTLVAGPAPALAQYPPDFYSLVDAGAVSAPPCACVTAPFAVPRYRPRRGYEGAAAPLEASAPPSVAELQRYLAARRSIARDVEEGRSGNPNASFGVALYLSVQPATPRADAMTEAAAMQWLHLAAEQGHPDAYAFLGYRYRDGLAVERSDQAAAYWFHRAAAEGNNIGMVALGLLYAAGRGVPQDWAAAVSWWRKAEPTHAFAARLVGDAYVCGLGVSAEPERATRAYRHAIERGEPTASMQLAQMYANGCASGDDDAAVDAFKRAAEAGLPEAQIALSEFLRSGRGGASRHADAYYWARLAERRLPHGALRMRAAAAVAAAARVLPVDEIAGAEQMVSVMVTEAAKPLR